MSNVEYSRNVLIHSSIEANGSVIVGENNTINQISVSRTVFSEINLEAYDETSGYVSPRFTGKIVGEIMAMPSEKMAVFSSFFGFDKAGFIKHLAFKLSEAFEADGKSVQAKEWFINSEYSSIATTIKESKENCIFVLNNLTPKDVSHNLEELRAAVKDTSRIAVILIGTHMQAAAWHTVGADYWFSIEADGLYRGNTLIASGIYDKSALLRFLNKSCDKRGLGTWKTALRDEIDKLIPAEVNSPEQIGLFLDLFLKKPTADEKHIRALIGQTKKKDTLLKEWFYSLDDDKQYVAIGMSLLEGVYDEQFFSIMQKLSIEAWRPFHKSISAIDYSDLSTLMHFFSFSSGERPAFEGKFPNQRFQILLSIWDHYRRRITATLPVIVELVAQSTGGGVPSWELFSDNDKRIRLLETLAEALSDIARISPQTVEPWLLQLAATGNIEAQLVAAKALAQLRQPYDDPVSGKATSKETALFDLLNRWRDEVRQSSSPVAQYLQSLRKNGEGSSVSRSACVRATILLALGFASVYDSSSMLNPQIPKLIRTFARDYSSLVVSRLRETLRLILRNHPWQVGVNLFDTGSESNPVFNEQAPLEKYAGAIAAGLADAYADYPGDVEGLLESWYNYCNVHRPKHPNVEAMTYREKILATVILTLGMLDLRTTISYDLDKVASYLEKWRTEEHHPEIRRILLDTILSLYERYFGDMEARHSKKIPNMAEDERKRAAAYFRQRYLFERSEAVGGDYVVEVKDANMTFLIESWKNHEERPLVVIENSVGRWVGSTNENIRRIGLQTLVEFAKIEAWEEAEVKKHIEDIDKKRSSLALPHYNDNERKGLWDSFISLLGGGNKIKEDLKSMIKKDEQMGEQQVSVLKAKIRLLGYDI